MTDLKKIKVDDRYFRPYLSHNEIAEDVRRMAAEMSDDLRDKNPIICPTLTGSFMFMTDLAKALDFDAEVAFVKYSSYQGLSTTGRVSSDLPFPQKCRGRHVVIVEDIVDTGITMEAMLAELEKLEPASVHIASYLFKPDSFSKTFKIDYVGRSIPNDFIVGYGMDYNGFGRLFPDIYVVDNNQ